MLRILLECKNPRPGYVHGFLTRCCAGIFHAGRDAFGGGVAGAQQEGKLGIMCGAVASHQRHGMAQHMQGSVSHTYGLLFVVICTAACT